MTDIESEIRKFAKELLGIDDIANVEIIASTVFIMNLRGKTVLAKWYEIWARNRRHWPTQYLAKKPNATTLWTHTDDDLELPLYLLGDNQPVTSCPQCGEELVIIKLSDIVAIENHHYFGNFVTCLNGHQLVEKINS